MSKANVGQRLFWQWTSSRRWRARPSLALALISALAGGCAPAPQRHHELRLALAIDATSLSPLAAFDQNQIALDLFWCQTLVGLDEHNRPIPVLVTRIPSRANGDVSADGLRISYHLRPEVRFADGVPLTSADVAFTYKALFDPANAATADAYLHIAALETPDPHTVVIRLRQPWSAAVNVLFAEADFAYGIMPKHAFTSSKTVGSAWDRKPFGTGPFRVVNWQRGDRIELVPNPYFVPKPKLDKIVLRIITDQNTAFNALQTHEVDVAELNTDNIEAASRIAGLRVTRTPENGLRALYFQTSVIPTSDRGVRRAIAYALDERDLRKAWRGVYPVAHSLFPAPLVSWRATEPSAYPYDPARAARELDAAGWHLHGGVRTKNGVPLALIGAIHASTPVETALALAVQNALTPLGASITLKSYDPTVFASPVGPLRTGRFTFTPTRYFGGSDPEQSINLTCATAREGADNYPRFCSPQLDALYAHQSTAPTLAARQHDFDAIARIVHDDVPLIPLFDIEYLQGVDTRVTGYARNMLRYPVHAENWDMP